MYYIYRITNKINGKTYIGQHKYKELNDSYMGSGVYIRKAQKKYGIENFEKNILVFNISKKEHADILEKTFIASEREKGKAEYNIADGGQGGGHNVPHSDEVKRKLRSSYMARVRKFEKQIKDCNFVILHAKIMEERARREKLGLSTSTRAIGAALGISGKTVSVHNRKTEKELMDYKLNAELFTVRVANSKDTELYRKYINLVNEYNKYKNGKLN